MHVKIRTKPITILLRYFPIPFLYVHGNKFKISISVKNMGSAPFTGGNLIILVTYAFGNLLETIPATVSQINPKDKVPADLKGKTKWGVLAHGHALLYATLLDNQNKLIPLYDEELKPLPIQTRGNTVLGYHIHSFYSLTRGEIYTLIALYVNILLAILLNYDKIVDVFRTVIGFINHLIN